jgi:hypothetical protein
MAKLADDLGPSGRNGSEPDVDRSVADLAEAMRGAVTPVIGYLELISQISQEGQAVPDDRHLEWVATIERRLEAVRELNDQILRVCDVLRDSVSVREPAARRAPAGPGD